MTKVQKNKRMKIKPIISLINFGCPKNLVDAEVMLGKLYEAGYPINLDESSADIIIVNTCSFIRDAEKESVKTIVRLAESGKRFIITGCLAQKYKQELADAVPEAKALIGTGDITSIVEIIENIQNSDNRIVKVTDNPLYLQGMNEKRYQITAGPYSYVKISEGCNYNCSFCIIPSLRGRYRSRSIETIENEVRELGEKGVSEIILIAQDTSNYGRDLYGTPSLSQLLQKLNEIDTIEWIRIMYLYPSNLDMTLIKTIASLEKVVKYIDIPLQHSHSEILKLMNRPMADYSKLLSEIRENIPDAAIRTAFITGFPGETEEHYEHLYNFVETHKFDKMGIFEYSKEKISSSYSLKNHIPSKIKKQRKKQLMELQQGISLKIHQGMVNQTIPVIVDTVSSKEIICRSYRDAPEIDGLVYLKTNPFLMPGDIIDARITEANPYDLYGEYN